MDNRDTGGKEIEPEVSAEGISNSHVYIIYYYTCL